MYIERTESSIIGLHKVSRPHWYLNFDKTLTSLQELGPPVGHLVDFLHSFVWMSIVFCLKNQLDRIFL